MSARPRPWSAAARATQERLRPQLEIAPLTSPPQLVAAADVHFMRGSKLACSAICVFAIDSLDLVDSAVARLEVDVPYQPGYLSFRELGPIEAAFSGLARPPDVLLLDGHGLAHPREFGLACHAGVSLDLPTIGCAKSVLCGTSWPLADEHLAQSDLCIGPKVAGRVLRSRIGVKPLYVSVGHRITLPEATAIVAGCLDGFRIPKPQRLAHRMARAAAGLG